MAFKVIISREYKDHPNGKYRTKRVRLGSQFCGEIREYKLRDSTGRPLRIFWAAKLKGEFLSVTQEWVFDKSVVSKIVEEGIPLSHIGVQVTANPKRSLSKPENIEELWLTKWETFRNERNAQQTYWSLPFSCFGLRYLEIEDDVKIKAMKVSSK